MSSFDHMNATCSQCGAKWPDCGMMLHSSEHVSNADGTKEIIGRSWCNVCLWKKAKKRKQEMCLFCGFDYAVTVAVKGKVEYWCCRNCITGTNPKAVILGFSTKPGDVYRVNL